MKWLKSSFVFDKDNRIPKIARGALKTKQKILDFIISRQLYFPLWYSLRLQSSYWHSAVHSSWNRFWPHMSHGIHKMDFFGGWIYESFSFPVPSTISPFLSNHPLWHVSDWFCSWTWLETRECAFQIQSVSHCPENYQIKCWQESSIRYIPHQTSDSQWWTVLKKANKKEWKNMLSKLFWNVIWI